MLCHFFILQAAHKVCPCFIEPSNFSIFFFFSHRNTKFCKTTIKKTIHQSLSWMRRDMCLYLLRNLISGRRLIVLKSVIDEGPYFCSVHKSTFCCFSPTYCLCWSIPSWRKPNVYISSLLKSPHSILKLRKKFWHSYSFITDTGKLWDIMRMSQERKMFIFDFSYLDLLRLFASYFQLRSTAWKASKSKLPLRVPSFYGSLDSHKLPLSQQLGHRNNQISQGFVTKLKNLAAVLPPADELFNLWAIWYKANGVSHQ